MFSSIDNPYKCPSLQSSRANISSRVSGLKSGDSKSKPCDTSAARACAGTNLRLRCGAIESSGNDPKGPKILAAEILPFSIERSDAKRNMERQQNLTNKTYHDGKN